MLAALTMSAMLLSAPAARSDDAATGTVSGRVTLTTRMRGIPISTNAYAPRTVTHQATPGAPEMRSVVIYLKEPMGANQLIGFAFIAVGAFFVFSGRA